MNVLTDCHVLWLDDREIIADEDDLAVNIRYFVSHSFHTFTKLSQCSSFLEKRTLNSRLLLLVVRDRFLARLQRDVLQLLPSQIIVFIYILGDRWLFRWQQDSRIRDIFQLSDANRIWQKLQSDVERHLIQRWSTGVCVFKKNPCQSSVDQLGDANARFMWFQLLVKVLLRMPSTEQSKNDLMHQISLTDSKDVILQRQIQKFHRSYQAKDAISWYTKTGFLFRRFNEACRIDDIDLLFTFRFFIRDLYHQLGELHRIQRNSRPGGKELIVYRGTFLSNDELEMLRGKAGGRKLIWFNTFVSTSCDRDAAREFVCDFSSTDQVAVLHEIHISSDALVTTAPFADIREYSDVQDELEILMAIGTVCELISITQNNDGLWETVLNVVDDDDQIRSELREYLEEDIGEEPSLLTLSQFLTWRGDFEKSVKYKELFLKEPSITVRDRAQAYNGLAFTYQKLNRFPQALNCSNTSIELYQKIPMAEEETNVKHRLAAAYNNRGLVYRSMGEYSTALKDVEKSLQLRNDDPGLSEHQRARLAVDRSYSYENLSLIHKDLCQYSLALSNAQVVLELRRKNLPSNHFMISQSCNNISLLYTALNDLTAARKYSEEALTSQIQALPDNHPHLSAMYLTLGNIYHTQGEYRLALSTCETALSIIRKARVPNRLRELAALNNIASAMKAQGNYDGALTYFLEALPVFEQTKPGHSDIARILNNIGSAYRGSKRPTEALEFFNRALDFCNAHLTETNELKAITYLALGLTLSENQDDLAMDYLQQAIAIYNQLGLPHHPNVISSNQCQGSRHRQRHNHTEALTCFTQALSHCREAPLPERHPMWITIYTNLAVEYALMHEDQQALQEYQLALQHSLEDPENFSTISQAMDQCRQRILEGDIRQVITMIINEIEDQSTQ